MLFVNAPMLHSANGSLRECVCVCFCRVCAAEMMMQTRRSCAQSRLMVHVRRLSRLRSSRDKTRSHNDTAMCPLGAIVIILS